MIFWYAGWSDFSVQRSLQSFRIEEHRYFLFLVALFPYYNNCFSNSNRNQGFHGNSTGISMDSQHDLYSQSEMGTDKGIIYWRSNNFSHPIPKPLNSIFKHIKQLTQTKRKVRKQKDFIKRRLIRCTYELVPISVANISFQMSARSARNLIDRK